MVKFLIGLIFGVAFCGTVLGAIFLLNPLPSPERSGSPAVIEQPSGSGGTAQPPPEADPAAAPAPEPQPDTPTEAAVDTAQETEVAAAPESQPEATPDPVMEAAPTVGASSDPETAQPPPESAAAMAESGSNIADTGETGDGGPEMFAAPQIGGGVELSSPALGGDSGPNLSSAGNDRPIRTAGAPQQVSAGSTDTGSTPAVNTESAAMPEIGGSELTSEQEALGPAPDLRTGNALAENSAAFTGDRSRPLMSIVLIDTGESPELRPGLTALTAPITFGVEANIPDATAVAQAYRDGGFEVSAVLPSEGLMGLAEDLPEAQVEPLVARVVDIVPVAATVMDPIDGPLPKDRRMANALLDSLAITGHGLLTHRGNGLNNLPIIAAERGVPSELVYRVIDAAPGAANISLALERAVLDASRSGQVIVVGHVRQETVTTLFSWLLGSGAREVTIAPASAVLRAGSS